jgi:hypothetical protein
MGTATSLLHCCSPLTWIPLLSPQLRLRARATLGSAFRATRKLPAIWYAAVGITGSIAIAHRACSDRSSARSSGRMLACHCNREPAMKVAVDNSSASQRTLHTTFLNGLYLECRLWPYPRWLSGIPSQVYTWGMRCLTRQCSWIISNIVIWTISKLSWTSAQTL